MRSNFMLAILLRLKTEWSFKLVRILLCMVAQSRNMLHSYEIGPIIRFFFTDYQQIACRDVKITQS